MSSCDPDKCIGCKQCRPLTLEDEARIQRALIKSGHPLPAGLKLRVFTFRPPVEAVESVETLCEGTFTCECRRCSRQRAALKPQGFGNADPFRRAA